MNVPLVTEAILLLLGRHVDMCNHTLYCDEVVSYMTLDGFSRLMYSSSTLTSSGKKGGKGEVVLLLGRYGDMCNHTLCCDIIVSDAFFSFFP